jgi:hypothetical protein
MKARLNGWFTSMSTSGWRMLWTGVGPIHSNYKPEATPQRVTFDVYQNIAERARLEAFIKPHKPRSSEGQ